MQNFTKEESSALLYLKLARDLGANDISINKSTCEVIVNLVERLMQKANGGWISVEDRLPNTKEHNKEYLCRCVLLDDSTEEYAYCLVLKWYLYDIIDLPSLSVFIPIEDSFYGTTSVTLSSIF